MFVILALKRNRGDPEDQGYSLLHRKPGIHETLFIKIYMYFPKQKQYVNVLTHVYAVFYNHNPFYI